MAFEKVGVEAVVKGLSKFNAGMRSINTGLTKAADGARQAQKDTEQLNKTMRGVGAGMLAAGAATGAFLFSAVRLAARVETLGVVTARLGKNIGLTREEIRGFEQGIVAQGITLRAARGAVARMIQTQIDLTQASKLARLAQDAAVIGNINSSEAFERLTFVIQSGNVRMARNLGLQVSFQQAYEDFAQTAGKTTLELTQYEKVQARTNEVIKAGRLITGSYSEAMETAGKKILSLDRQLEESRRILGEAWLPVFADAVDVVTDLLKAWQNLTPELQGAISIFLGVGSIAAVLTGTMLLLAPSLIAAAGAATALNISLGVLAGTVGLIAVAFGAVLIAGVKWLAFVKDTKGKSEAASAAMDNWHQEILTGSENFEEYQAEVRRVNKVIDDQSPLVTLLVDKQEELTEAQFEAGRAAEFERQRFIAAHEAMTDTRTEAELLAEEEKALKDAELEAARAADIQARSTAFLEQQMKDLNTVINADIIGGIEDYREEVEDLEQELEDLGVEQDKAIAEIDVEGVENVARAQERLAKLRSDEKILLQQIEERKEKAEENDTERSESSILREQARLQAIRDGISEQAGIIGGATQQQVEALAVLNAEYAEKEAAIREQISETTEAFNEQTARIIFDMAQQRLAIDGLTREEIIALRKLAGPDGLGIIDETAVALLDRIDDLAEDLAKPGDQSDIVAQQLDTMFGVVSDGTIDIDNMAEAIRNLPTLELVAVRTASGEEIFVPVGSIIPGRGGQVATGGQVQAAPITTPETGSDIPSAGDNFEMTVNTVAPQEDIIADFQMMRAMSDRNRGGFIE